MKRSNEFHKIVAIELNVSVPSANHTTLLAAHEVVCLIEFYLLFMRILSESVFPSLTIKKEISDKKMYLKEKCMKTGSNRA